MKAGAKPAFLGYRGYPATLCISVNEEVVHGIPGKRKLKDGDIVGLDLGCIVDGFFGDAARTVAVGRVSDEAQRLMRVTEEALHAGHRAVPSRQARGRHRPRRPGARRGARLLGGAGVRRATASGPACTRTRRCRTTARPGGASGWWPGMCLAIEPMVNAGGPEVKVLADGWTAVTVDGSLSAHFELSVAVTPEGPWILSEPYPYGRAMEAHA